MRGKVGKNQGLYVPEGRVSAGGWMESVGIDCGGLTASMASVRSLTTWLESHVVTKGSCWLRREEVMFGRTGAVGVLRTISRTGR